MSKTIQLHDLDFELFIDNARIQQRIKVLGAALAEQYEDKCPIFLAILNGSFVFAADLVRACGIPLETSFVKVASYEGIKSSGHVSTLIGLTENIKGRHIVLIEDIIDTGGTIHQFLPELQEKQPQSIRVVSFLSKPDALQYPLSIDYVGFEIPNKFVVGYGLDYNGLGRNLPDIYQLIERK